MLRKIARLVAGLVGLALWAAVAIAGLTGFTHFKPAAATTSVSDRGVARVADCRREGPVSVSGFGYWWLCEADVVWDSGGRQRVTVQIGQLGPDDAGRDVPVVQRLVADKASRAAAVYRADFEPSVVLGLGSVLGGLGFGFLLFVIVFGSTLSATERKLDMRGTT